MKHKFYKIRAPKNIVTGLSGRIYYQDGVSLWITKEKADNALFGNLATKSPGKYSPYYEVVEYESYTPLPDECICHVMGKKFLLPVAAEKKTNEDIREEKETINKVQGRSLRGRIPKRMKHIEDVVSTYGIPREELESMIEADSVVWKVDGDGRYLIDTESLELERGN